MNSVPYGYGGRSADISVFPVKIIMSPTCSSRFFVGKNALSATARTTSLSSPGGARTVLHQKENDKGEPRQPPRGASRGGMFRPL